MIIYIMFYSKFLLVLLFLDRPMSVSSPFLNWLIVDEFSTASGKL